MVDLYRDTRPHAEGREGRSGSGLLRPFLWLALVVFAAANALSSFLGLPVGVGVGFGLATLACVVGLVADHRRRRADEPRR